MVNEVVSWSVGVQVILVGSEGAGEVGYIFLFVFIVARLKSLVKNVRYIQWEMGCTHRRYPAVS
jgi:hypothetical protein